MPYTNVLAFKKVQAKLEATRGTAEVTMTRWLTVLQNGGVAVTYSRDREDAPETLRSFAGDRDTALTNESVTISIEARLSYEEIPWWFSLALNGAAATLTGTTTGSTPPGYTYTIAPDDTTDNLDTATLKIGDGSTCYIYKRFAVNTMTIRCNPNAGGEATWRINLEGPAVFVGTGTFDSPVDISRTMVLSNGSKMYLDTTTIGTTQLTGLVRNFSVTVANNIEEKRFIETGVAAASDFGRGLQRVTGDFTAEHLTDTQFAQMRANTALKLRFEQTGANIGSTPTTDYRVRIDIPQARLNAPSESYAGQNMVMTYPFIGEKGTATAAITTATVNAVATVTA
jgi:hypothetical protein